MSKCAICRTPFKKLSMTHKLCGNVECAVEFAQRERVKRERKESRVRREKLKTRSDWIKETQEACNEYVRERDRDKPCICCGLPLQTKSGSTGGSFDAGHYRSVGSAPHLRFDAERNIHGQRKYCNRHGAGRAVDYRLGLISRIGLEQVEALEADQEPRHYSIEELKALKAYFKAKTKALRMTRRESCSIA